MKHKYRAHWHLLLLKIIVLAILTACTEFLVPNLTEETLEIYSPADSLTSKEGNITFWWAENDLAEGYSLQIVSPDFSNPSLLLIDTLLYQNSLMLTLEDGAYKWRIRMENEAYASDWQTRHFGVDSTYME